MTREHKTCGDKKQHRRRKGRELGSMSQGMNAKKVKQDEHPGARSCMQKKRRPGGARIGLG